jgi:hypothetical protein
MGKRRKLHSEKLRGCKIDRKSYVWAIAKRVDLAGVGDSWRMWYEPLAYPGGVFGGFKPPRNSEVLKKLGQNSSFEEYTSVTT